MTAATANARFWDRIAPKYAAQPISDEAAYERRLEITQKHLNPEMEVIEIGCGTGSTALRHAPHVARIEGVDISHEMIRFAREKTGATPNAGFRTGTLAMLAAEGARTDGVLALNLLHLLDDLDVALERVAGMLPEGGLFVSSTPCLSDFPLALRMLLPVLRWVGYAPRVMIFGREELEARIRAAGFRIVETWQPSPRASLLIVARKEG